MAQGSRQRSVCFQVGAKAGTGSVRHPWDRPGNCLPSDPAISKRACLGRRKGRSNWIWCRLHGGAGQSVPNESGGDIPLKAEERARVIHFGPVTDPYDWQVSRLRRKIDKGVERQHTIIRTPPGIATRPMTFPMPIPIRDTRFPALTIAGVPDSSGVQSKKSRRNRRL